MHKLDSLSGKCNGDQQWGKQDQDAGGILEDSNIKDQLLEALAAKGYNFDNMSLVEWFKVYSDTAKELFGNNIEEIPENPNLVREL